MNSQLVTFNAGSSTVKVGIFEHDGQAVRPTARGAIDFNAVPLTFRMSGEGGETVVPVRTTLRGDLATVFGRILGALPDHLDPGRVAAIGHRVVHGGDIFAGPVLLDESAIAGIDSLSVFAPLHQPQSLSLIRAIRKLLPSVPQTASFDTAFHRTMPDTVRRFALPGAFHDRGVKRYGFHGLSYKSIAGNFARLAPELAGGRVVVAHLGSGASLCGMQGGRSLDTSMGFSTLDGIPMATRCGALDPGALLYLTQQEKMDADALSNLLYKQSGLLGLSGISGDTRRLFAENDSRAREAIDIFTLRIAGEVCRLAATLGGLDALIFTAGIGEHQPQIRSAVCDRLAWLGLGLDPAANTANAFRITRGGSPVAAFMLATDEEHVIATEALETIAGLSGRTEDARPRISKGETV